MLNGTGNRFYDEDGNYYSVTCRDDQGYNNPWTVGNTCDATISLIGYTTTVSITVEESPVESIEVTPITMIENTDGYWSTTWNEWDEKVSYYCYYWWNKISFTITMKDGTVYTGRGNDYWDEDEGIRIQLSNSDNQDYDNAWTVGNTYEATVSYMGKSVTVPVTLGSAFLITSATCVASLPHA